MTSRLVVDYRRPTPLNRELCFPGDSSRLERIARDGLGRLTLGAFQSHLNYQDFERLD
jgi:hypothetical protein